MQEPIMTYRQWRLYQQAWFWAYECLQAIPDSYTRVKRDLKAKLDAMPEPEVVPYIPEPAPDNKPTGEGYKLLRLLDDDTTHIIDDGNYRNPLQKEVHDDIS